MHTAPSFVQFPFLSAADKVAIARALVPLTLTVQQDTGQSFQDWLDRHRPNEKCRGKILEGHPDQRSERGSGPDFCFCRGAGRARVNEVSGRTADGRPGTAAHGSLQRRRRIRSRPGRSAAFPLRRWIVFLRQGTQVQVSARAAGNAGSAEQSFDYLVVALPFDALDRVLPDSPESAPLREKISHFENSPITGIHLWFDRQISELDHAVLLDRTIQWMFHKSRLQPIRTQSGNGNSGGSYIELVVSSSKSLIDKSRNEIVELALAEVREFFPAARSANLVKSTVIKEVNATYSPRPGIDAYRPSGHDRLAASLSCR